jgi:hypothetical protein
LRQSYKPTSVKWLFIAESPPPTAGTISTRHFYRTGIGSADRLFANTIKALYGEASKLSETELAEQKESWLHQFQSDGCYMIECLDDSLPHDTTPAERKQKIKAVLPQLISKVRKLASADTKVILIKSNPYNIATTPLRAAGFNVINQALIDYPGYWREEPYRQKLAQTMQNHGWKSNQ